MNWNKTQLLAILPRRMRQEHFDDVTEVRLRLGRPPRLITFDSFRELSGPVEEGELRFVLNAASGYSPWNAASMADGYLTAPGGHRIGVCGESAGEGIRTVASLCIRIARDLRGISEGMPTDGSLLILGPPGCGKTTLLRDHIRIRSKAETVAVVDERWELFPEGFSRGENTDVMSGVAKDKGIDMVLRSMGPAVIAMDEITCPGDCKALVRAAWCGVQLLATVHASSVRDLHERSVYRPLVETGLFSQAVVLDRQRRWKIEEVAR